MPYRALIQQKQNLVCLQLFVISRFCRMGNSESSSTRPSAAAGEGVNSEVTTRVSSGVTVGPRDLVKLIKTTQERLDLVSSPLFVSSIFTTLVFGRYVP